MPLDGFLVRDLSRMSSIIDSVRAVLARLA